MALAISVSVIRHAVDPEVFASIRSTWRRVLIADKQEILGINVKSRTGDLALEVESGFMTAGY